MFSTAGQSPCLSFSLFTVRAVFWVWARYRVHSVWVCGQTGLFKPSSQFESPSPSLFLSLTEPQVSVFGLSLNLHRIPLILTLCVCLFVLTNVSAKEISAPSLLFHLPWFFFKCSISFVGCQFLISSLTPSFWQVIGQEANPPSESSSVKVN